jgi:hypothetical protein
MMMIILSLIEYYNVILFLIPLYLLNILAINWFTVVFNLFHIFIFFLLKFD